MAKGQMDAKPVIAARQVRKFAEREPVISQCPDCGGSMEGRHQNYGYTECGLKNVVLLDVLVFNCNCGAIVPEIPAISVLHRFIAVELLRKPTLLSGDEVRFMRKLIGYSSTQLADLIGVTNISLSRWENEAVRINRNSDRLLRLAFFTATIEEEAHAAYGDDGENRIWEGLAFAKKVKTFNLTTSLKQIKAVHQRYLIRVDPTQLAEFGRSGCAMRRGSPTPIVQ